MSRPPNPLRALPAYLLGACALCATAQYLVVRPELQRLDTMRAQINALLESGAAATRTPVTSPLAVGRIRAQTLAELSQLRQHVKGPADESEMFAAVSRLAAQSRVRVDSMSPGSADQKPLPDRGSPAAREIILQMSAVGSYQNLASFLANLEHNLGVCEVASLRMTPITPDDPSTIRAVLRVRHLIIADPGEHPASPIAFNLQGAHP
ncbi:MAG: hypothetical protein GC200_04290 [Tepidisphaera sp.]|nr:hypothetical protein [Tepidisphaera sp.]